MWDFPVRTATRLCAVASVAAITLSASRLAWADAADCGPYTVRACPNKAAKITVGVTNLGNGEVKVCVTTTCPGSAPDTDCFTMDAEKADSAPFACDGCSGGIRPDDAWGLVDACGDLDDPWWTVLC